MKNPDYDKDRRAKLKARVVAHYSDGQMNCACCGQAGLDFLTVDHVYGGGTRHRKEVVGGAGNPFYQWLESNDYPEGYQILCANCNFAKKNKGQCPHQSSN